MKKIRVVAAAEVAGMLGVGVARVHALVKSDPKFPEPLAELRVGKVWDAEDIEAWMRATGRGKAGTDA